jgi:hypothetical protein
MEFFDRLILLDGGIISLSLTLVGLSRELQTRQPIIRHFCFPLGRVSYCL